MIPESIETMLFTWIKKLLKNEMVRYALAGFSVTVINIGTYTLLLFFGMKYTSANLIALVLCKSWGFIANKFFVYKSHTDLIGTLRELVYFFFSRGLTALIDYFGLILFVEQFQANEKISKYIITALVIILNYILGKFVFRNESMKKDTGE